MAEPKNLAGLEGSQSVSALGLRWAALRGMLSSPLITTEEQSSLRDELVRELRSIEQDFATLQSRNLMEVSAKIDVAKTALRESMGSGNAWVAALLESVQNDLQNATSRPAATPSRPVSNLPRSYPPRAEGETAAGSSAAGEGESSSAA
ncbi:hypothetical protein [Microvirga thermotolerans]|uniref:Uncharacterized protein n=1 Tax=Microvirga thermotolerans TaxID=2651334 RepID=A0A5P9K5P3_9HYPH|nr:hypothetical protein [Microvirga thermotolerans]QFU17894.1 hypothetical protein GDR74_17675 [Microvirga thermotolerans]